MNSKEEFEFFDENFEAIFYDKKYCNSVFEKKVYNHVVNPIMLTFSYEL